MSCWYDNNYRNNTTNGHLPKLWIGRETGETDVDRQRTFQATTGRRRCRPVVLNVWHRTSECCTTIEDVIVVRRKLNCSTPLFDAESRAKRRECHLLERRFHRTCIATDWRAWVDSTEIDTGFIEASRSIGLVGSIPVAALQRRSVKTWKTMSPLLGRNRDVLSATRHRGGVIVMFLVRRDTGVA